MSIINEELRELISQFNTVRKGSSKSYPDALWKKAISVAQKLPFLDVCHAIKVSPVYLRKKIAQLPSADKPMKFVELIPPNNHATNGVTINIETPDGYKLMMQELPSSSLVAVLSEVLNRRASCYK
jgi:hypothetical protein